MSNLLPESMLAEIRARAEVVPLEPPFSHGAFAIADRRKLLAHIDACSPAGASEQHQQALDRACYVIMELMQAYERRIRSDCTTPEQLAANPWECAEYIKAERFLKAIWKDGRAQPFAALDEFLGYLRTAPEPSEQQDAARYRFLRGLHDPGPDDPRVHTLDQQHDPVQVRLCFGDDLDAVVDAAMRQP